MIRRNIELETKLIDDLLDLSRITNNKLRLELAPVAVNEVVRHVLSVCAADIQAKHIAATWQLTAPADEVMADSARLHQSLWNLVKNAVKFTPEGGRITLRTSNPEPGRLRIEVEDSGIGIAPEALTRIFDAFEQAEAGTSRQFGGLGLGLAISRAIITLHGGTLRAESGGKGTGAKFTLELPTIAPTPAVAPDAAPADPAGAGRTSLRLLVVEDHYDTAHALNRLLRVAGYSVKTAGSVAAALRLAEAESFDLLISDLGLPDESGYALMQQVRERYGLRGIAMSGYGMEDDIRRSREAGFAEHLIKPISIPQLENAIRRVVGASQD